MEIGIWQAFRAYGRGNMPLQAVKLPISRNNVVGENTVLQLNILETGVLTLVVQNSSPTRRKVRWRTYNSPLKHFGDQWLRINLQWDEVELEMNSEPWVWEHQSSKCFSGELCSVPPHHCVISVIDRFEVVYFPTCMPWKPASISMSHEEYILCHNRWRQWKFHKVICIIVYRLLCWLLCMWLAMIALWSVSSSVIKLSVIGCIIFRLVFSHKWFRIHLQRDEVELEMNSEPQVSPEC